MPLPCLLVDHPRYQEHDTGSQHPENPSRVEAIRQRLRSGPLKDRLLVRESAPASRAQCLAVHDESYLFRLEESCLMGLTAIDHPDNQIGYDSFEVALLAAGGGIAAIDLLERGEPGAAFSLNRPPGHHAESYRALGFCLLNNVAIAARHWQSAHGRRRILILDWDAHHGNGIQNIFLNDPEVFYISIHEHPTFSFPGTGFAEENGAKAGQGLTLNIPLPPGAGDREALEALECLVAPALAAFKPQALLVAAGFDGHADDDMSGLLYSTGLYGRLGIMTKRWGQACEGRVVSILEGGYHLESLAASVEAYLLGLSDD